MERGIIARKTAELSLSTLGEVQADHEIWEETDGGAHFIVTRHLLPEIESREILAVSVSGAVEERNRIYNDFYQIFGPPASYEADENVADCDVFVWLTPTS
jgi:hypothetical protein